MPNVQTFFISSLNGNKPFTLSEISNVSSDKEPDWKKYKLPAGIPAYLKPNYAHTARRQSLRREMAILSKSEDTARLAHEQILSSIWKEGRFRVLPTFQDGRTGLTINLRTPDGDIGRELGTVFPETTFQIPELQQRLSAWFELAGRRDQITVRTLQLTKDLNTTRPLEAYIKPLQACWKKIKINPEHEALRLLVESQLDAFGAPYDPSAPNQPQPEAQKFPLAE
jgi:hypothetical protein